MPQSRFRIIHFSDPHTALFTFQNGGLFDKRLLGRLNHLLRRRHAFCEQRFSKAAKVFSALEADLFVCTGDLTSVGDPAEFARAEQLLAPILELAQGKFFYVPGNHDVYVRNQQCRQALEQTFYRLNGKSLHLQELPALKVAGPAEIILCNTARPSPIYSSNGEFLEKDWEKLENQLNAAKTTAFRILLEHFPTLDQAGKALSWRRCLKQAEQLNQWQQKKAFDALLCGHIHQPFILEPPQVQIICAGSLTLYASFAVIDLDKNKNHIKCEIKKLPQLKQ